MLKLRNKNKGTKSDADKNFIFVVVDNFFVIILSFFGITIPLIFYLKNKNVNEVYRKLSLELRLVKHITISELETYRLNNDGYNREWLVPSQHHLYLFDGYFIVADSAKGFFTSKAIPILVELKPGSSRHVFTYLKRFPIKTIDNRLDKQREIVFHLYDHNTIGFKNTVKLKRLNSREITALLTWLNNNT